MARRIDRARKLGGGLAPERMSVAPEVYQELVIWWRRKSRFNALLGHAEPEPETEVPASIMYDGVEIYADADARVPWSLEFPESRIL